MSIDSAEAPSEQTGPGWTELTRTPDGLNSAAHARVIAESDALVALYAAPPARPTAPAMLSRLTMLPRPRAAIAGAIAAVSRYAGRTLLANRPSNVARSVDQRDGAGQFGLSKVKARLTAPART